ncbi:flippase [uncultured Hyphomicrobium sp.]|uniref:flippase n=1 Tax=uncultured Hyphomicrobium sp. TaxID=194373 RepID=UPI0025E95E18|nr:flippase [uncultured Hyphomicrobium sp.]
MIARITKFVQPLLGSGAFMTFSKSSIIQATEQLVNIVFGLFVTVYMARVFGPDKFGVWSLATSIILVSATSLKYGLDLAIIRHCSDDTKSHDSFLASAIVMRLINAVGFMLLAAIAGYFTYPEGAVGYELLLIMLPVLLFIPLETLEAWFRATKNATVPAIARITAILTGSALKIALVAFGASMALVGVAHVVQLALVGVLLLVFYLKRGLKLKFDAALPRQVRELYVLGAPLFITTLANMVYMRCDVMMLAALKGDHEVGVYAAATRIYEAAQIAPVVLMTAAAPFLFRSYRNNLHQFLRLFQVLLTYFNVVFIAISVVVCLLSPFLIHLLFGEAYHESALILAIQIVGLVFVAQGVATEYWWIARGRLVVSMKRTLAGAVANVLLNLLLIPPFGAVGAAIASVLTVFITGIGVHLLLGRGGRHLFRLQAKQRFSLEGILTSEPPAASPPDRPLP